VKTARGTGRGRSPWPRRLLAGLNALSMGLAYLAGALLLLASFYITVDVLGRKFVGVSSGVTDEFGGYALAIGGMWALAFALTTGAHVRIDVLLPHFPRPVQLVLNYLALVLMGAFAAIVAWYAWKLAGESYATAARAMSFLGTPLFIPQGAFALGFTLLALQATVMLLVGLTDSLHARRLTPVPVMQVGDLTEGL
jgi:TRAP-type C4-dicarboxylate transport system permease small subunit